MKPSFPFIQSECNDERESSGACRAELGCWLPLILNCIMLESLLKWSLCLSFPEMRLSFPKIPRMLEDKTSTYLLGGWKDEMGSHM